MKNFNSFVGYLCILTFLLMACEPEGLSQEEVSPVTESHLTSSTGDEHIQEGSNLNCTTVSANEWPDGRVPEDFTEGVTITTSDPNSYIRTYQLATWLGCYDLTKSLSTPYNEPSIIFSFDEDVVSFSVRVIGVVHQMDNIYVTAYSDIQGAGDIITTVHYPVTSIVCTELSLEGSGIRSIVVTSDGEETNAVNIGGFSFCTNPDTDGDGVNDDVDNCPLIGNPEQEDNDNDGMGDACDADDDNDGILDEEDNCPLTSNPLQEDNDNDGIGDACDPDDDNDGVLDEEDNCPLTSNALQEDYDGDGMGDACDPDDDNDGILDVDDAVPFSNTELTIKIGDCDTGISNEQLTNGIWMSDLIDELETGEYKNLGQEIKSYNDIVNKWLGDGLITGEQKSVILGCVI